MTIQYQRNTRCLCTEFWAQRISWSNPLLHCNSLLLIVEQKTELNCAFWNGCYQGADGWWSGCFLRYHRWVASIVSGVIIIIIISCSITIVITLRLSAGALKGWVQMTMQLFKGWDGWSAEQKPSSSLIFWSHLLMVFLQKIMAWIRIGVQEIFLKRGDMN